MEKTYSPELTGAEVQIIRNLIRGRMFGMRRAIREIEKIGGPDDDIVKTAKGWFSEYSAVLNKFEALNEERKADEHEAEKEAAAAQED